MDGNCQSALVFGLDEPGKTNIHGPTTEPCGMLLLFFLLLSTLVFV